MQEWEALGGRSWDGESWGLFNVRDTYHCEFGRCHTWTLLDWYPQLKKRDYSCTNRGQEGYMCPRTGIRYIQPLSHVRLFVMPCTVARQAPLSVGFSRQKYWSGLPFPTPRNTMGAVKFGGSQGESFQSNFWASLVAQMVKNLLVMQKTQFRSLSQEDPLKEEAAAHSSLPAWRIPWTEEPGGLQSMGSQKVRHNWEANTFQSNFTHNLPKFFF